MKAISFRRVFLFLRLFVILAGVVLCLYPIYEMVSTSLKTEVESFSIPPKFIFTPTFENYIEVLFKNKFLSYFFNSLYITGIATFGSVGFGAMSAYALARLHFRGKSLFVIAIIVMRMIAPVILVVPVYILFNKTGILDSRTSLAFVYIALNLPFNIWVLRTFILEIPHELEESAIIEGCSDFTVFRRIILPLLAPGLSVAGVFTFRIAWNEFILGFVLTNRITRTLPVAISLYLTDTGTEWGKITAIATIIAVPAFIFTFTAAKSLIMGLTAGAVKG